MNANEILKISTTAIKDFAALQEVPEILHNEVKTHPAVQAEFLAAMLQIFPCAECFVNDSRPELAPLYFTSSTGDGCICPVRKEVC